MDKESLSEASPGLVGGEIATSTQDGWWLCQGLGDSIVVEPHPTAGGVFNTLLEGSSFLVK